MRIGFASRLAVGLVSLAGAAQEPGGHAGTFDEALEHRSFADLRQWSQAHPWSLGDRLGARLESLLETRRVGERLAKERADLEAAFLSEALAEDPFSGWIHGVSAWDAEACSHHETVLEALGSLPAMIAAGERDAAWAQIADLRDHVEPPGGWALSAPALARVTAAFLHAGDTPHAAELGGALAASAAELRQGAVLAACERVLGEIARRAGDLAGCERRTSRSFEIAAALDSGDCARLLDEIEGLEARGIDTVLEIAIGEKQTLVVAAGVRGRAAKLVGVERAWIEARVRRLIDAPATAFDAAAARELHEQILLPVESVLGPRLGIVRDAPLAVLPLELLSSTRFLAEDHAIVYFARPPIGARPLPADDGSAPKTLRLDASEKLEPAKARAELVLLASERPGFDALADAFHAAGVRDVLGSLRPVDDAQRLVLARLEEHRARGEDAADALRAVRKELLEGDGADARRRNPWTWAAWIVHRRD
jgi:hypothetical protein